MTPVTKLAGKPKTLVVEGEKVTELTDEPDLVTGDVTVACLIRQLEKHRAELVVARAAARPPRRLRTTHRSAYIRDCTYKGSSPVGSLSSPTPSRVAAYDTQKSWRVRG